MEGDRLHTIYTIKVGIMSINVMSAIFKTEFRDLPTGNENGGNAKASSIKLVMLAIADHANDEGESAYPGLTLLQRKTALSRQGLIDVINACKFNGLLFVDEELSKLGTNNYHINLSCFPCLKDTEEERLLVKPLDQSSHLTSTSQATLPEVVKPLDLKHQLTIKEPSLAEIEKKANKTVDAILENARISEEKQAKGESWPGREKMPEPIRDLLDVYVKLTGQRPTKGNLMDWLSTGQDWLDLGINKIDLEKAYQKSKGEEGKGGFVVGRPGSLTNTANMFAGERRTGNNNNPQINWKGIEETKRMLDEKWGKDYGKPKPIGKIVEGMTHDEPGT